MAINIPKYWHKVEYKQGKDSVVVNGWSHNSQTEAVEKAEKKAKKVFDMIMSDKKPDSYEYFQTPIREEIVENIYHDGKVVSVISRNRYGALVLNTENVLFADRDFKPFCAGGFINAIKLMFNPKKKKELIEMQIKDEISAVIEWGKRNPGHPFRLYRTFAGLRLIFTGKLYDPKDEGTLALLDSLGSDPMYIKLTKNQSCFRARMTPKPWRIKCDRPPHRFPYLNEKEYTAHMKWLEDYSNKSRNYKICTLIGGADNALEICEIKKIVDLHDRMASVKDEMPLA